MVDDIVRGKGYLTLGSRMKRIGELLQAEVQLLMNEQNIPVQSSQYPLLAALDENGPLAVGDLAEALGVSQPGVTRSVSQLAGQGIVRVKQGRKDQRMKIVSLSGRGRAVVQHGKEEIWPQIETCLAQILSGRKGPLLEQLDALEDALARHPFSTGALNAGSENGDG